MKTNPVMKTKFKEFIDKSPKILYTKTAPEWANEIISGKYFLEAQDDKFSKDDIIKMIRDNYFNNDPYKGILKKVIDDAVKEHKKIRTLKDLIDIVELEIKVNKTEKIANDETINKIFEETINNYNNKVSNVEFKVNFLNQAEWANKYPVATESVLKALSSGELNPSTNNGWTIQGTGNKSTEKDISTLCVHYKKTVKGEASHKGEIVYNTIFGLFNETKTGFTLMGIGNHSNSNSSYKVLTTKGEKDFSTCDMYGTIKL